MAKNVLVLPKAIGRKVSLLKPLYDVITFEMN